MKLPVEFLNKMNALLGDEEYAEFLESYNKPRHYGLRVNTLKISVEEFLEISPFSLEGVPWARDGFYYPEGESPGKHPYYHAGLYYIQEPSAMLPGEVIDARPGERILDLCAAPGGKTVQIAAGMKGKGILIANDISSDRVKALVKNIELCGVKNAIVTNDSPEKLARNFEGYFDKILVDAPCSGEGMFRKDEDAARSWENFKCDTCAGMQRDILATVDKMLKPGGYMVYSTCTFSPEENERMIAEFIDRHKGYELIEIPKTGGIESGRPNWANGDTQLAKTVRLWPHRLKGEGHFVAKLRKDGENCQMAAYAQRKAGSMNELETFYSFAKDNLNINIEGYFEVKGNNLYNLPEPPPDLRGIKVAKFGWYMGELARNRFEPSHSMATALKKEDIVNILDLSSQSSEVLRYLKGETIMIEGKKGYTAICVDGYTLGWGKQTGEMLKNLYPKGWRKMG
jgi:NOL1/NOP2/sun family putative RNA methylase